MLRVFQATSSGLDQGSGLTQTRGAVANTRSSGPSVAFGPTILCDRIAAGIVLGAPPPLGLSLRPAPTGRRLCR